VPHGIAASEVAAVAAPFAVVMLIFPVTAWSGTLSATGGVKPEILCPV
jgi:hypothetical protein